ncbi:hypothetical protein [Streptomyces sp. MMS24-I29]|uniref:hypothetical protein n=1 Tax=Streptomyces sp. MMS24-I29 TaxID=3351480 RepID=UPI003C7CD4D6
MSGSSSRESEEDTSVSEQLLFGGRLTYDIAWNRHQEAWLVLTLLAMARKLAEQQHPADSWHSGRPPSPPVGATPAAFPTSSAKKEPFDGRLAGNEPHGPSPSATDVRR